MEVAKVFITTYKLYNEGRQFESDKTGAWYDLDFSFDIESIVETFESVDGGDELMVTDFDNMPEILYSESSMNFEQVIDIFDSGIFNDETILDNFDSLVSHFGNIDSTLSEIKEGLNFHKGSLRDLCINYVSETYEKSNPLYDYVDYDRIESMLSNMGYYEELSRDLYLIN